METTFSEEVHGMLGNGDVTIIDVRTPEEFENGHITGALNIDINSPDFEDRIKKLDPEKQYVVYCQSGGRSGRACSSIRQFGFHRAMNLAGGIVSWEREGFSIEK